MDEDREDRGPAASEGIAPTPPETPETPRKADKQSSACINAFLIGLIVVILGFCALTFMPPRGVSEKAKEAEVKANLHNIQLAVERFAVDTDGAYPSYLIGGEAKYTARVDPESDGNRFTDIREIEHIDTVSDPLLRLGYIDAYPRNPFVSNGIAIHQVQEDLPTSELYGEDPLRNATAEGRLHGTRFGADCTLMGSVLADPRQRGSWPRSLPDGTSENLPTYADVEWEFWDLWIGNKPKPYLPGQFFYKGLGPVIAVSSDAQLSDPILPTEIDQYMLGGYGGIRTKGKDILGQEQPIKYFLRPSPEEPDAEPTEQLAWPMTRSEVSDDPNKREGSPFSMSPSALGEDVVAYGNPNGIRDGIILVLTGGTGYYD